MKKQNVVECAMLAAGIGLVGPLFAAGASANADGAFAEAVNSAMAAIARPQTIKRTPPNQRASQTKTLECSAGRPYERFSATLDYSSFDPGSGFFRAANASFYDNYLTLTHLTCEGYQLSNLNCVGFAFGRPDEIEDVTLSEKNGQFFAALEALKGETLAMHDGPWPCKIIEPQEEKNK